MLLYRVFPSLATARTGRPGHPEYLHLPQGHGRWDNPDLYAAWYFSTSVEGAIAETFGNLRDWTTSMFETPFLSGSQKALGVFEVDDAVALLDYDDANNLLQQGMRPTQVVIRNTAYTQARAAAAFGEVQHGPRRWVGLRWWSFHRAWWTNVMLWQEKGAPPPARALRVDPLSLTHVGVQDAGRALAKI